MRVFYHSELLKKFPICIHAVTTKNSKSAFYGSLALHTGENAEAIIANRKEIITRFEMDEGYHFVVANQTHSAHIVAINQVQSRGWISQEDAIAECDALITNQKGVILTILTADCVPILLFDREKEVIAAVHAGWKGTKSHIALKTVQKMQEHYGSNSENIIAYIGPAIGKCCYEVGEEVAAHFVDKRTVEQRGKKFMLDLPLINQKQLLVSGLKEENIELSNLCTSCEVETFFSYRKECGCSGRFMSMIGLKAKNF